MTTLIAALSMLSVVACGEFVAMKDSNSINAGLWDSQAMTLLPGTAADSWVLSTASGDVEFTGTNSSDALVKDYSAADGITLKTVHVQVDGVINSYAYLDNGQGIDIIFDEQEVEPGFMGFARFETSSVPNFVELSQRFGLSVDELLIKFSICLLYTSPSPRDATLSRMPSSA